MMNDYWIKQIMGWHCSGYTCQSNKGINIRAFVIYRRHAVSNCPYRWREIVLEKKKINFHNSSYFFCLFLLSMYVIYRYFIVDMIDSVASEKNKTITIGAGVYIHTIYYAPWIGMCVMPLILSWRDIDSIPELYVWYAKGFPSSW